MLEACFSNLSVVFSYPGLYICQSLKAGTHCALETGWRPCLGIENMNTVLAVKPHILALDVGTLGWTLKGASNAVDAAPRMLAICVLAS